MMMNTIICPTCRNAAVHSVWVMIMASVCQRERIPFLFFTHVGCNNMQFPGPTTIYYSTFSIHAARDGSICIFDKWRKEYFCMHPQMVIGHQGNWHTEIDSSCDNKEMDRIPRQCEIVNFPRNFGRNRCRLRPPLPHKSELSRDLIVINRKVSAGKIDSVERQQSALLPFRHIHAIVS